MAQPLSAAGMGVARTEGRRRRGRRRVRRGAKCMLSFFGDGVEGFGLECLVWRVWF